MTNPNAFRSAAALVCGGVLIFTASGLVHPARHPANDHVKAFAEYAASTPYALIHIGQFAGILLIVTGLVLLFLAVSPSPSSRPRTGWAGVVASVAALALYGVLQAVDGVALKQAADTWVQAPDAEKAVRWASAESIRWIEWGVRSYHSMTLGLTFVLFGIMLTRTAEVPRAIGYLMALSGVAYGIQAWVLGVEGFSAAFQLPAVAGVVLPVIWSIWLVVASWRKTNHAL